MPNKQLSEELGTDSTNAEIFREAITPNRSDGKISTRAGGIINPNTLYVTQGVKSYLGPYPRHEVTIYFNWENPSHGVIAGLSDKVAIA